MVFCCGGGGDDSAGSGSGTTAKKAAAKKGNKKYYKSIVVSSDEKTLKQFFQHVRFISEEPLESGEVEKAMFFIRRQKLNDLIAFSEKLKLGSNPTIENDLKVLQQLSLRVDSPIETRENSNKRILGHLDSILRVASFVEASTAFGYADFEKIFENDYVPKTRDILSVADDGITSDWAPINARIVNTKFAFMDCLSDNINLMYEIPEHELLIVVISSMEVLEDTFKDEMIMYKSHICPCLVNGGPTLVFLLTNLKKLKSKCKADKIDHSEKIEEATKRMVEMCCEFVEDSVELVNMKLPLVTL